MSAPRSRWKPRPAPQGRSLDPFIGALSRQALGKRAALIGEIPGRATKSRRSRADGLRRQNEDAFRQLFDMSPNALILSRHADFAVLMVNEPAERMFGVSPQYAMTRHVFDFFSGDEAVSRSRTPLRGGEQVAGIQAQMKNAAGEVLWALISCKNVMFNGEPCVLTSVVDVTERERAESALVRLNADLEARIAERTSDLARSNHDLETFSYTVAHDLRAPLRAILGFGRLLLEDHGNRLPADGLGNLQRVLASAARMGRMIDDLLQLSQLARQPLSPAGVDIAVLSRELMAELAAAQPTRSVSVVAPDSLPAAGDARLLKIALQNLLGNAWKFTSRVAQARIEVGEAQTGNGRAFFVRDNGAGFDMAYAGKLFKVFQRLHSSSEFEGTGVGLATVERIILRHGGRTWAETAPGRGATFYFTLPSPQ
jgi:PAS domain S-box-containing protein